MTEEEMIKKVNELLYQMTFEILDDAKKTCLKYLEDCQGCEYNNEKGCIWNIVTGNYPKNFVVEILEDPKNENLNQDTV